MHRELNPIEFTWAHLKYTYLQSLKKFTAEYWRKCKDKVTGNKDERMQLDAVIAIISDHLRFTICNFKNNENVIVFIYFIIT